MRRRLKLIPVLVVLLTSAVVLVFAADDAALVQDPLQAQISESSAELQELQGQLKTFRDRMASLDDKEADFKRSFEEIDREIEVTQKLLSEMDQRERLLKQQSEELKIGLGVSGEAYSRRKAALAANLRAMYIHGRSSELELILTSGSFANYVTRLKYESMMARLAAGLVEQTRNENQLLHSRQRRMDGALAEIWSNREEIGRQTENLAELKAEQLAAIRDLDSQRKGLKNRMLELTMNEQRLTYILADLEQQREEKAALGAVQDGTLAQLAGHLEWPVQGQMIRGFGRSVHPEFKTVTLNNGINIQAATGSPVASVATGAVEYADSLPGFGQCVILDHGVGYYTLYAYLDGVFVAQGEKIARGQVIGEVGRPSPGEAPQLYFEVRHGRTPLDPVNWLKSR